MEENKPDAVIDKELSNEEMRRYVCRSRERIARIISNYFEKEMENVIRRNGGSVN